MKRFLLLSLLGLMAMCPGIASAAGTITVSSSGHIFVNENPARLVLTLTCTADAAAATFPTFSIDPETYFIRGWYLYSVETDPGSTAPTGLYDITIVDAAGHDVAGGLLANRSATATEKVYLGAVGAPVIDEAWTFTIANNAVNSAAIVAKLVFVAE